MDDRRNNNLEGVEQDEKYSHALSVMPIAATSTSDMDSSFMGDSEGALTSKSSDLSNRRDEESKCVSYEIQETITPQVPEPGGKEIPSWRFTCLSWALAIGLFMSFMDGSITSTALYTIGIEFDSTTKVSWIALAYTLADVGLAIVFTTVANIIGRFNAYLVAQSIFMAFSFASGFAQTLDQLIAFRCLQGIGGSGLYTLALIIWQEVSTPARRKWVGGSIGMCVAAGGVMGPILGGIITDKTQWRWIFWINPPILVVSTTLFIIAFPHGGGRIPPRNLQAFRRFDMVGCILLISGCVLPCFALMNAAETANIWSHGIFIGPMVAGAVSWILLVCWGLYVSQRDRLDAAFPPHLFKHRRYAATAANSLFMGIGFVICIYNVPLRLQTVNGKTPLQAGLCLLPLLCFSAIGSFLGTALSPKKDNLYPTLVTGSAFMALGIGLLTTLSDSPSVQAKVYGFQVFVGLGFGMTASSSSILANIESKPKDHAVAQGVVAAARVFGGSLGLAGATAIQGDKLQTKLAGVISTSNLQHLSSVLHTLSPQELVLVRTAYADSFYIIFLIGAMGAVAAFVAALFSWNSSKEDFLDRLQHKGEHGDDSGASSER